jgi:hypothetical protein
MLPSTCENLVVSRSGPSADMRQEREVLKKALVIFSKGQP